MDSELNRSQTVIPFGVGAIYDYLNYTAISLSVDDWDIAENTNSFHALKINNPRLQYFVNKKLKDFQKDEYVWVQYFLNPPIKKEQGLPRELNDIFYPMPVKKFPEYYVCTRCGHLSKPHPTSNEKARCNNPLTPDWLNSSCGQIQKHKKPFLEPSRFIGFCEDEFYFKSCMDLINENQIDHEFIGSIPHEQLSNYYLSSDIFCLPTLHENYGHVILEALSYGLPIIISQNTPWRDLEAKKVGFDLPLLSSSFTSKIDYFFSINNSTFSNYSKNAINFYNYSNPTNKLVKDNINLFS